MGYMARQECGALLCNHHHQRRNNNFSYAVLIILNGAGGRTRTGTGFLPTDFHTTSTFVATFQSGTSSWSGLSLHQGFRRRCCPSSLYTFPFPGLARDWHRYHYRKRSPNLGSSTPSVSAGALKIFKSVAATITPRPHWLLIAGSCYSCKGMSTIVCSVGLVVPYAR